MQMYTQADAMAARRRVRRCAAALCAPLALLLALYVAAVVARRRGLMCGLLLAAFVLGVFIADNWLLPALRYRRFLREMQKGLRRACSGCIGAPGAAETRDGARVRPLEVRLDGGETRVFYLKADCAGDAAGEGARLRIESWGRHIVGWEEE